MKLSITWAFVFCLVSSTLLTSGCKENTSRQKKSATAARRAAESRRESSVLLMRTISSSLNGLPNEIVLELAPPRPILDDSKSLDGKEVLATCQVNPAVPDGPFNYLEVPKGNVDFRKLGVRAGDIVRYFVAADEESVEFGIRKETYFELPVRRLDAGILSNTLIVEVGLNGPVLTPERMEIWRFSDKRMNEIRIRLTRYIKQRKPNYNWEPSPDESALVLLIDRLNQWLRNFSNTQDDWKADSSLEDLPRKLLEEETLTPLISKESLQSNPFQPFEARELQQAIWLRDISVWAKSEGLTDLEVASALFDWTVRNIQLDGEGVASVVHRPWQTLMYGHGTAEQRAWVFAELCRQQQLDVVMLSIAAAEGDEEKSQAGWWLPALFSEGKLYLFDAQLGLPLPGKTAGEVATLAEVVADASMLEKLNLGEEFTYPLEAEQLSRVEARLVASPLQLSRRASLLQQALEGDDFVVLSVDNRRIAKELKNHPHVTAVHLWTQPWEAILAERSMDAADRLAAAQRFLVFSQRPRLWKARVLHFQGTKEIPFEMRNDPLAQPDRGHVEATKLYQNRRIRPANRQIEKLKPAQQMIYRRAKGDASFWIGLLSYDRGKYEVAADWLQKRTLEATPEGPWSASARYNLARAYEKLGKLSEAIEELEAGDSPQRHGNLLRARQLRQQLNEGQ